MQELALSEGALPRHLHTSMFTISSDQRMLTNRSVHTRTRVVTPVAGLTSVGLLVTVSDWFPGRQLSRHLVGLWTAENPTAMNLLKRILVGPHSLQTTTPTSRPTSHSLDHHTNL